MDEGEWTVVESRKTRKKRTSQQVGSKRRPPRNSRTTNEAHISKERSRSSFAKESAIARGKQTEYIPQNHRIYSPLNRAEHEIRLLVLKAGWGNMALKCRLLKRPLAWAEQIGFETVSYCWGDLKDQGVIDVEGFPLRVPISAIDLLQQFRYPDKDRILWIDSICLNQLDLEERGHEVARMHHIYSSGQRNLIWLGLDDGNAAAASHALCAIRDDIEGHVELRESFYDSFRTQSKPPRYPDHISLLNETKAFRKTVVYQAMGCPGGCSFKTQPIFLRNLPDGLYEYDETLSMASSDVAAVLERIPRYATLGIWAFAGPEFGFRRDKRSLSALIVSSQVLDASDPRDHVYGFLGLLQSTPEGKSPALLQPDYGKDDIVVFRDATRYTIYQDGNLLVLSFITSRINEASCSQRRPHSWVPRWSRKRDSRIDASGFSMFFDASLGIGVDKDICGLTSSETIDLRGLFIEQPDQAVMTRQSGICEDLDTFFYDFLRFVDLDTLSNVPEDASSVLWRVLVAAIDHDSQIADESMAHTFQALLRYYKEREELPPLPRNLSVDADEELVAISKYLSAMSEACYHRRVFKTAGGRMGLGPQTMEPGDVAVILHGGKTPFILRYREDANDYEFIGECYVDGIMFGEAVQKHREEGREDVIFNIR